MLILYDPPKNFLLKIHVGVSNPLPPPQKKKQQNFMLIPNSLRYDAQKNVRKMFQAKTLEKGQNSKNSKIA
jgi:hypothetical protein